MSILSDDRFYRYEVTCSACGKTRRMAAWERQAQELDIPMILGMDKGNVVLTCPRCVSRIKSNE